MTLQIIKLCSYGDISTYKHVFQDDMRSFFSDFRKLLIGAMTKKNMTLPVSVNAPFTNMCHGFTDTTNTHDKRIIYGLIDAGVALLAWYIVQTLDDGHKVVLL